MAMKKKQDGDQLLNKARAKAMKAADEAFGKKPSPSQASSPAPAKKKKKKKGFLKSVTKSLNPKKVTNFIKKNPVVHAGLKVALSTVPGATTAMNEFAKAKDKKGAKKALESKAVKQVEVKLSADLKVVAKKYGIKTDKGEGPALAELAQLKKSGKIKPEDDAKLSAYAGMAAAKESVKEDEESSESPENENGSDSGGLSKPLLWGGGILAVFLILNSRK